MLLRLGVSGEPGDEWGVRGESGEDATEAGGVWGAWGRVGGEERVWEDATELQQLSLVSRPIENGLIYVQDSWNTR